MTRESRHAGGRVPRQAYRETSDEGRDEARGVDRRDESLPVRRGTACSVAESGHRRRFILAASDGRGVGGVHRRGGRRWRLDRIRARIHDRPGASRRRARCRSRKNQGKLHCVPPTVDAAYRLMRTANLGDSGFMLVEAIGRDTWRTDRHQEHEFGRPFQLGLRRRRSTSGDAHHLPLEPGASSSWVRTDHGITSARAKSWSWWRTPSRARYQRSRRRITADPHRRSSIHRHRRYAASMDKRG